MKLDDDNEKSVTWKLFFIMSGFISLFMWNSLLNILDYFEKGLEVNSFGLIAFVFCFGQIASFFTSSIVFDTHKIRFSLNFALGLVLLSFISLIYFVEFTKNTETNKICTIISALIMGYMSGFFRGKSVGLAAQNGPDEILYVSFGTGLAGILTNLFSFFVSLIFPTSSNTNELPLIRIQVLVYLFMTIGMFAFYLLVQYEFHRQFKTLIEQLENGEKEIEHAFSDVISNHTQRVEDEWRIISCIKHLMINAFVLYVVTILFVVYFNVKCYFAFDDNKNAFNVAYYMFFFNISDTVGKLLPDNLIPKSKLGLFILTFFRIIVIVSLGLTLSGNISEAFATPAIRVGFNVFLGFTNGFLTNGVYAQALGRFNNKNDRGKSEYLIVLSLVIGVGFGSLGGVILNDLHIA